MASAHAWQPAVAALCLMHVAPRAASVWLLKPGVALLAAGVTGDRSQNYARDRRIVKTDEFSSVFRLRPVQRTAHFVLYTRNNQLSHARLGVVAAKRFAPRAVTRNTIKRVTRELFRQTALPTIDCIVRLSKPVNTRSGPATSASLKAELRSELQRLFLSQRLPEATR
jgi:ribonuclease P protein component